jgi:hypothetical protein
MANQEPRDERDLLEEIGVPRSVEVPSAFDLRVAVRGLVNWYRSILGIWGRLSHHEDATWEMSELRSAV